MTARAPTTAAASAAGSSADQKPDSTGWPRWIREALAYEPENSTPKKAGRDDERAAIPQTSGFEPSAFAYLRPIIGRV